MGELGVTYGLHLQLVGKRVADFLFAIIELFFAMLLRLRCYKQILVQVGAFQWGWVTLRAKFRWKRTSPPTIVGIRILECFCYLTVNTA